MESNPKTLHFNVGDIVYTMLLYENDMLIEAEHAITKWLWKGRIEMNNSKKSPVYNPQTLFQIFEDYKNDNLEGHMIVQFCDKIKDETSKSLIIYLIKPCKYGCDITNEIVLERVNRSQIECMKLIVDDNVASIKQIANTVNVQQVVIEDVQNKLKKESDKTVKAINEMDDEINKLTEQNNKLNETVAALTKEFKLTTEALTADIDAKINGLTTKVDELSKKIETSG